MLRILSYFLASIMDVSVKECLGRIYFGSQIMSLLFDFRFWYSSHMRVAEARLSLHKRAASLKATLLTCTNEC